MKRVERNLERGNIGFIVLLIVVLIVGYLAMKNFEKTAEANISLPGSGEKVTATTVIDKFKGDAKRIEELQNADLPPVDPEVK